MSKKKFELSPDSEWNERILEHKTNEVRLMVSGSELTFLDRGKIFLEFKEKSGLSDSALAKRFAKDRSTISREIRLYLKSQQFGIDKESYPDTSDRILIRALEIDNETEAGQFIKYMQMFPEIDFSRLVSLLNGTLTIDDYRNELTDEYEATMKALDKLETIISKNNFVKVKKPVEA